MFQLFKEVPEWAQDNVTVHAPDVDAPALRLLLDSLYTSELRLTAEELTRVRSIQHLLGISISTMVSRLRASALPLTEPPTK